MPQGKFTEDTQSRYLKAIKVGATKSLAAQYAGVSSSAVKMWIEKGEAAAEAEEGGATLTELGREFAAFYRATIVEESGKAIEWTNLVEKLGRWSQDWRAIAWLLERRYPKEYGRGIMGNGEEALSVQHIIRLERGDPAELGSTSESFGVGTEDSSSPHS